MADEEKKEIIQVTSLEQLGSQKVNLVIELPDAVLHIPAHTMTYAQWIACAREVPQPNPPEFAGKGNVFYNREDPDFRRRMDEWNDQVAMLRVLKCLDIPIEGNTQDEKLATLTNKLGAQVTLAIVGGLTRAHTGGLARVQSRADTFLGNGTGDTPDMREAELAAG